MLDFVGEACDIPLSRCHPSHSQYLKCKHGGRCREKPEGAYCECPEGLTGDNCEELVDDCKNNNTCDVDDDGRTHGTCINTFKGSYCYCDEGYNGTTCSVCLIL